jgi:hypothetical protein
MACMHCSAAISVAPTSFPLVLSGSMLLCVRCALRKSVKDKSPIDAIVIPEQVAELRGVHGPRVGMPELQEAVASFERLSRALIAGDGEAIEGELLPRKGKP